MPAVHARGALRTPTRAVLVSLRTFCAPLRRASSDMCGAAVEDASPPAYALMPGDEGPVMLREGPEPSTARPLRPAEVVVHLLKANIGPGVLALPMHFAALGPAAGCATLAAVASQGIFGMWLLVRTQQQQQRRQQLSEHATGCEQRLLSFADLGELAYGRAGRLAVQLNVCALQLGVCAVFLGLVGDNLTAVLPLSRAAAVLVAYGACAALCLTSWLGLGLGLGEL